MATMYVGGGLYLPTTGTASKTSTPTGGTVTVAQRNAIASAPKSTPVASSVTKKPTTTTAVKKPTTNTLSTMAGSSLGTTSTKTKPASSTASLVTGSSSAAAPRNTAAQNAAVASLLSGAGTRSTGGINAALPQPPRLTKAQIGNRFAQSLASGASTGAAVPNPAGLTRDEADTLRSRFYRQFYSGQPVQRIADKPVPVSYDYMLGPRNDDRPYVSPYDAARYGIVTPGPDQLPSNQFAGSLNGGVPLLDTAASNISATLGGAANALFGPGYGMIVGAGKALQGGPMVQNFGEGFVQGEGDVRQLLDQIGLDPSLNPRLAGNAADIVNVGSFAGMLPGVGAAMRTAAMRAGAGIPRTAAVIPQAAGIDAALTPRQAAFRQLMDSLNADPANAALATPRPVSAGPRVTPGGGPAISSAEIARLDDLLAELNSAPRPASVARLPTPTNLIDEGIDERFSVRPKMAETNDFLRVEEIRRNEVLKALAEQPTARGGELFSDIPGYGANSYFSDIPGYGGNSYPNPLDLIGRARAQPARGGELFSDIPGYGVDSYPGPLFSDIPGYGPTRARADTINRSAVTGVGPTPAATGRNAFSDVIDAMEAAKAAKVGNAEKAGPYVAMSADEAADVLRPGPRVPADKRMDPFTKNMLLIAGGGAGVALPGLAGLSLLANGQLGPAPAATTPQPAAVPGGIDVASGAPRSARALRQAQINQNAANLGMPAVAPQLSISPAATSDEQARLDQQVAASKALQEELGLQVDPASFDPTAYPTVNSPGQVELVTTSEDINRFNELFEDDSGDVPRTADGAALGVTPTGTAAPAAGTKFTPGPGQFVGTNGYIYEQSSDGSFERVGRVPGYTPAQLSEAANKGAFRDPNNIVVGSGKRTKKDTTDSQASSSGSSKKRKPKDETDTGTGGTGTGGTGTGGTGTSPYTPEMQAMLNALYGNYMRQYNGPGVGYVPGVDPERNYFTPAFADGGLVDGRLVLGDGGPKEDKIPAMIDGVEQAKLSNGEFVMTAAAVKNAGGGDIELGAKRLMDLNNMLSYGKPADRLKVQHVK